MFSLLGRPKGVSALATASAIAIVASITPAYAQEQQRSFNIPPQELATALIEFSRQADVSVMADSALVNGRRASAVQGTYTPTEALHRLLADSGLVASPRPGGGFSLVDSANPTQLGAADRAASSESEIITVTGTRIRGAPPAAPTLTVTRDDIDQSGYGQIGEVIRSLPENFSGGQNPGVIGAHAGNAANVNGTNSSTVNLRGLGTDATLVLVNGRRLSGDALYQGSDISGIPLAAVQRVELVLDGASALYGSDAVAGVANFIMRRDFDGSEISVRLSGATEGGGFEQTYSVLGGVSRPNWHALANVEYSEQDGITASQRDFTSGAVPYTHLVRPSTRTSFFFASGVDVTDSFRLSLDALASERNVDHVAQARPAAQREDISYDTPSYSVSAGAEFDLPGDWRASASWVASGSENTGRTVTPVRTTDTVYRNQIEYLEATAEGELLRGPGGPVRLAIGGGARQEDFRLRMWTNGVPGVGYDGKRDVNYAFAEAFIPLVVPSDDRPGLHALDLSIAARYEDYSDLGDTSTPQFGIRYVPLSGLTLRGTWGESFKAPAFIQMLNRQLATLHPGTTFGQSGGGTVLYLVGGERNLQPETATSWTAGFDFRPPALPSLEISATYFNIDYTDRVVTPVRPATAALTNPIFAPFIVWNPTAAEQQAAIATSTFTNSSGQPYDPNNVVAMVFNRSTNAEAQRVEGVDLSVRQRFSFDGWNLSLFGNASWLEVIQQTLPTMPEQQLSGTIANAPEWRARTGLTWELGGLRATGIVNYVGESRDTGVTPSRPIGSWTTIDTNFAYEFGSESGALSDVRIALGVSNLLNEEPPFAQSPNGLVQGILFDSTTASPIGRVVSLSFRKRFGG